ncbi:MAG: hypothetical protein QOF44_2173, partial [Streptomyces sp.]|nr:hypothetical protein [Streptomyces sp.]
RGTGLLLGLLGGKPGEWHEGDLPELLRAWLAGRTAVEPAPVDVDAWTESLDAADEAWVLAGETLAARVGARHKVLATRESAWSDAGAAEVAVVVGGRTVRLALPDPEAAVRILRGEGWRRGGPAAPLVFRSAGVRQVAFPGNGRRLVARSERADELITVHVPQAAHLQAQSTPRKHSFPWPVLAAGYFGRRLVVLGLARGTLRVQVVGKPWKVPERYAVPAHHLGIGAGDALEGAGESLAPLVVDESGMMCRWAGDWYRMPWNGLPAVAPDIVSALPATGDGRPRIVLRDGGGLRLPHLPEGEQVLKEAHAVLGPGIAHARSLAGHVWRFGGPDGLHPGTRRTEEGEEPLGVVLVEGGQAHLVTRSASGLLLRMRGPMTNTVLTQWSGSPHPPALHPSLPLLAVQRVDGTIDVADLATGNRLLTLRSDA